MKIHRPVIKKLYLGRSGVISTICTMAHTSKISLAIICANRNTRIYTFNSDWLFSVDYFTKREYRHRSQTSDNIWVTDFQQPPFVRSWFVYGCVCVVSPPCLIELFFFQLDVITGFFLCFRTSGLQRPPFFRSLFVNHKRWMRFEMFLVLFCLACWYWFFSFWYFVWYFEKTVKPWMKDKNRKLLVRTPALALWLLARIGMDNLTLLFCSLSSTFLLDFISDVNVGYRGWCSNDLGFVTQSLFLRTPYLLSL